MSDIYNFILPGIGVLTFTLALVDYLASKRKQRITGSDSTLIRSMSKIGDLIKKGGFTCLNAQYIPSFTIASVLYLVLKLVLNKHHMALGVLCGFLSCLACVYYCFTVAMSANIRTALSSLVNLRSGFITSYKFGRSVGLFILSASLAVISIFFFYPKVNRFDFMLGTALGVSTVSIFARLAGGIFTKGADIGADLVGKVIKDMPEDDPRNPGTIADNIGDNIGDCVGTAADIHETYILAFMAIAYFSSFTQVMIPALASTIGSIIGIHLIRNSRTMDKESHVWSAMFRMILSSLIAAVLSFFGLTFGLNSLNSVPIFKIEMHTLIPFVFGIIYMLGIFAIINYFTSKESAPVQFLAESCKDGAAMNIIGGYAISLQSAFVVIAFASSIGLGIYNIYGINGLLGLISTVLGFIATVMTMDTYGPITDNAGGIVTMAGAPEKARENTDALDSIGNLTKALTKGYSSGITIITSFLLLQLFFSKSGPIFNYRLDAGNPIFLFGIFLGASVPFIFSGLVVQSVHKAAKYMLLVIQKLIQSMNQSDKDYYTYPIGSLSRQSVRSMIMPLLTILFPVVCAYGIYLIGNGMKLNLNKLFLISFIAGNLIGVCTSGLLLSVCMTIGGATWDNTKKLVESLIGKEIKSRRAEFEELIESKESFQNSTKGVSVDSLQIIANSFNDLVKLDVSDVDKGNVFDTFKQAITTQVYSLQEWLNQNKANLNGVKRINLDLNECFKAMKEGDLDSDQNTIKAFSLYGELERLKAIKDAAVVGDMLGDPLKDAAGTGLNSAVKLCLTLGLVAMTLLVGSI